MKFSIAAAAIAATSSFVGVHASTSTAKSGKGSCSSSPKLEKFCYEEPANFEGTYHICYSNVVRSSATGILDGAIPLCPDGKGADVEVFTKLDEFGAYTKSLVSNNEVLNAQFNYQGIAQGNSIKLTSFGGGVVNDNGDVVLPNETPDNEECTSMMTGSLSVCPTLRNIAVPTMLIKPFFHLTVKLENG